MDRWEEVFKGIIPVGNYCVLLENGEEKGLSVKLESDEYIVNILFGIVGAVRMLDEGLIFENLFDDEEISKYKKVNFDNTIYKIENGEFKGFLQTINKNIYDYLNLTHYVIVTMNYVIEVMSEWEPTINIIEKWYKYTWEDDEVFYVILL